ncbi:MAG: CoA transferase [Gammaproteobacteria bacterium]|nr:CoA transferase [Gammaproteobacteria bacterium]
MTTASVTDVFPRVLELGDGTAVAWAGRLLADAGAEVLRFEPSSADSLRARGLAPALHINKGSVAGDFESVEGQQRLEGLLIWADVLLLNLSPTTASRVALDPFSLSTRHPRLVTVSITPFGVRGPRAGYQATELTVLHGGGWANVCPSTHSDPDLPPLKVFGEQSAFLAGTNAAMIALATWRDARRSGTGDFIDLSQQAYIASVLEAGVPALGYRGLTARRFQPRGLLPWRIFEAKDAPVYLVCIEQDQWERLVQFLGTPEWAQMEIFADNPGRAANQDILHELLQQEISQWKAQDLYHAAQQSRIAIAPVLDYAALQDEPHLCARGFFQLSEDERGQPLRLMANPILRTNGRAAIRNTAPEIGADDGVLASLRGRSTTISAQPARRPLEGIRVLDLTWAWAGPFCSLNLAHLGAEVIRIESSLRPDLYRRLPLWPDEMPTTLNTSGMFNQWHQGKRSVAVNMRTPEGKALVLELIATADVVVQNFATGVLDRMGLGYDVLKQENPRIILASVSGFGQSGPCSHYMGYGPSAAALTGLCSVTGYEGGGPEELGLSMPDPTSGLTAALGVVEALLRRDRTGAGDHIDVSLWEATAVHGLEAWLQYQHTGAQPSRSGNHDAGMSPHNCYRTAAVTVEEQDSWVTIACRNDAEWQRLASHIDPALVSDERFTTLATRKRHEAALDQIVGEWAASRGRWAITRDLQALGIAAFPTLCTRDIADDPHLNARGFIERHAHPEVGVRPHTGIPWTHDRRPNGVRGPAPCLGADTDAVLRETLGLDDDRIRSMRNSGVLI